MAGNKFDGWHCNQKFNLLTFLQTYNCPLSSFIIEISKQLFSAYTVCNYKYILIVIVIPLIPFP